MFRLMARCPRHRGGRQKALYIAVPADVVLDEPMWMRQRKEDGELVNKSSAKRKNGSGKLINRRVVNVKVLTMFMAAFAVFALTSCGQAASSSTSEDRPVITVGSSDYPPFMDLDNNGNPTGLDVDILKEAFDRIGYDIEFVSISWENKDDLLASGEIDCVTGGFTVEGRENDYLWVGPYMNSNQVVVVNSTGGITCLEDLKDKVIAVQAAGIAEEILLTHSNPNIPAQLQVFSYADNTLPFATLGCNYVDALIADEPVVVQYMKDYSTIFKVLDEPVMYAGVGTAFAKDGDAQLCAKLNAAIDEMRDDGTLSTIIERYLDDADRYLGGGNIEK